MLCPFNTDNNKLFFSLTLGVMIWQVSQAVLKYLSWQTETKFAVSSRGSLPLPAITFCNINSLRSSALRNFTKDERLDKLFDKVSIICMPFSGRPILIPYLYFFLPHILYC